MSASIKRKMELYKLSTKVLTIVCIILMASVLIFTIITTLKQPVEYCETNECIRSAASMKFSMNVKTDPCQDFFKYTCGRWQRENFLPPNYKKYSKLSQITERINSAAHQFLSDEDAKDEISPVKQSRMFYRSCVNRSEFIFVMMTDRFQVDYIQGDS
ncbi:neprilysin-like [Coccinella septempunctata]|uniref:neprilysin-like n=1 Tax=Coccinella septempunctata TaxID=41139 RepID=UPI001D091F11|nr:neprilysin-like [Coccinella septempunctata]